MQTMATENAATQTGAAEDEHTAQNNGQYAQARDEHAQDQHEGEREGEEYPPPKSARQIMMDEIAEKNRQAREAQAGEQGVDGEPGDEEEGSSPDEEMITIKVDGQEKRVPRSQVIESGVRTLQKIESGDERLRKAADLQRQLQAQQQDLARREAEIQALAQRYEREYHGKAPSAQEKADAPDFEAKARAIANAIYEGDEDAVVKALTEYLPGREGATPPDMSQMVQQAAQQARDEALREIQQAEIQREVLKAQDQFRNEFPQLASRQEFINMADAETLRVYEEHPDWSPSQIVTEAGKRTTELLGQYAQQAGFSAKQERKRGMSTPVRSASARATPAPGNAPKSRSEVIKDLRRSRGQPVI
jgi:hypothetical protein